MAASPLRPDQIQHILKLYKVYIRKGRTQANACEEIGNLYGRSPHTIRALVDRITADTTDIAKDYIKSNALRLAMRVVREGSVAQAMDILERPNIGVLAPKKQVDQGSRGFFLTVSADSCGAVKVGAAIIDSPEVPQLEAGEEAGDDQIWQQAQQSIEEKGFEVIDVEPVNPEELDSLGRRSGPKVYKDRGMGKSPAYKAAVERAQKRLTDAKQV
jgi:hypothetical protein